MGRSFVVGSGESPPSGRAGALRRDQDEPVHFASVLLEFLRNSDPVPFDKADLRGRLTGQENPAGSPS